MKRATAIATAVTALLAACAAPAPPAPGPGGGLAELMERPAERALFDGIRAYDDGQYAQAEAALRKALGEAAADGQKGGQPVAPNDGLRSNRDRATAHKLLAFITCTSERSAECERQFRAARAADPGFVLSRSEAGHPLWGPVYRKLAP